MQLELKELPAQAARPVLRALLAFRELQVLKAARDLAQQVLREYKALREYRVQPARRGLPEQGFCGEARGMLILHIQLMTG